MMQTSIRHSALLTVFIALTVMPPTDSQAQGFKLDTLTMETQSGSEIGSSSSKGKMVEFFKAQKKAVYHILNQVGISESNLPAGVRAAINRPQTTSFKALVAFSSAVRDMGNRPLLPLAALENNLSERHQGPRSP